jgi:hypothetical protein
MSWKKPKKIKHSKYCFYPIYSTVVVYSTGHFLLGTIKPTVGLFAKDITASEQNKFQATNGN